MSKEEELGGSFQIIEMDKRDTEGQDYLMFDNMAEMPKPVETVTISNYKTDKTADLMYNSIDNPTVITMKGRVCKTRVADSNLIDSSGEDEDSGLFDKLVDKVSSFLGLENRPKQAEEIIRGWKENKVLLFIGLVDKGYEDMQLTSFSPVFETRDTKTFALSFQQVRRAAYRRVDLAKSPSEEKAKDVAGVSGTSKVEVKEKEYEAFGNTKEQLGSFYDYLKSGLKKPKSV